MKTLKTLAEMKGGQARLTTFAEYVQLHPREQGFVVYMEAEIPGSELKNQRCPYVEGTWECEAWKQGEAFGVQVAQDSEE